MFIELSPKRTASLQRSEILPLFGQHIAHLRSIGSVLGGLAINIWPLCGQAQFCLRTLETPHYLRATVMAIPSILSPRSAWSHAPYHHRRFLRLPLSLRLSSRCPLTAPRRSCFQPRRICRVCLLSKPQRRCLRRTASARRRLEV